MNVFPDSLRMEDVGCSNGSRLLMLSERFRYFSSYGAIYVPSGMVTDGASIPRMFWAIMGPMGDYFKASVVHDFLYSRYNKEFSRKEADLIFKEAMFNTGVPWYRRNTIYKAVRLFGGPAFKANTPQTT
jgi:hypothetical protein